MDVFEASGSRQETPEQFQEKCVAVFRPELRQNKEIERPSLS
ncbi:MULTISPECIES: hypothetical protein [unclassified Mesorhizobium]|nr:MULTISPECIES: hypothetical protein [unclassified Mesorhizobium]